MAGDSPRILRLLFPVRTEKERASDIEVNAAGETRLRNLINGVGGVAVGWADLPLGPGVWQIGAVGNDVRFDSGYVTIHSTAEAGFIPIADGNSAIIRPISYRAASAHAKVQGGAARGTAAAPGYLLVNDDVLEIGAYAWDGTGVLNQPVGRFRFYAAAAHGAGTIAGGLELRLNTGGAGASDSSVLNVTTSLATLAPPLRIVSGGLTFTDGTYDIGDTGTNRPRDLWLSGKATVQAAARPTYVAEWTGTTAKARFGKFATGNSHLTDNVSFDGAAWNLDDVTITGDIWSFGGSTPLRFRHVTAGANPRTPEDWLGIDSVGAVWFYKGTIRVQDVAGTERTVELRTGAAGVTGARRWVFRASNGAEAGADAGSNFFLDAYNDSGGGLIDSPFVIVRAAGGAMTVTRPLTVAAPIDSRISITGATAAGAADVRLSNAAATTAYDWLIQGIAATGIFRIYDNAGASTGSRLEISQAGLVTLGGGLAWAADGTSDVGASGANRPRDLFLSRSLTVGFTSYFGTGFGTMPAPTYSGIMIGEYGGGGNGELQFLTSTAAAGFGFKWIGDAGTGQLKLQRRMNTAVWSDYITHGAGGMTVAGVAGSFGVYIANAAAAGSSYGLLIDAGGNAGDEAITVRDRTGASVFFNVTGAGVVRLGGNLTYIADGTYDIGPAGANRPRDVFLSRDLNAGQDVAVGRNLNMTSGAGDIRGNADLYVTIDVAGVGGRALVFRSGPGGDLAKLDGQVLATNGHTSLYLNRRDAGANNMVRVIWKDFAALAAGDKVLVA